MTVRDLAVLREWQPVDAGVELVAPIIPQRLDLPKRFLEVIELIRKKLAYAPALSNCKALRSCDRGSGRHLSRNAQTLTARAQPEQPRPEGIPGLS